MPKVTKEGARESLPVELRPMFDMMIEETGYLVDVLLRYSDGFLRDFGGACPEWLGKEVRLDQYLHSHNKHTRDEPALN